MKNNIIKIEIHTPTTREAIDIIQERTNKFYIEQVRKQLQKSALTKAEKTNLLHELAYSYSNH